MEITEPQKLAWTFENVLVSLVKKVRDKCDDCVDMEFLFKTYDGILNLCDKLSGFKSQAQYTIFGILAELDARLSGTELESYTDMLRYCLRSHLVDKETEKRNTAFSAHSYHDSDYFFRVTRPVCLPQLKM